MDIWKEVWDDRQMDVCMVAWMEERMHGCMDGQRDGQMEEFLGVWIDGSSNVLIDGEVNG